MKRERKLIKSRLPLWLFLSTGPGIKICSHFPNVTEQNLYEEKLYNRCHDSELETLFEKLERKNGRNRAKTKMRQVCAEDNNSHRESVTISKAIFSTFCFVLCLTWKLCHLDSGKN